LRVLGPAAAGDTHLQSGGALALLTGPQAARAGVGRILSAAATGTGPVRAGVIVPRSAIVRADAGLFVWRALGGHRFERVVLEDGRAGPQGWFVPVGRLHPGDAVVVSGAGTLLGLDHAAPAADAGDD
jgi:multidrug efflux pump subunit AcrA (membrane-fusion protein)